jgi:hypothetical protein
MPSDEGWESALQLGAAVAEALGATAFAGDDGPQRAALVVGKRSRKSPAAACRRRSARSARAHARAPPPRADCLASEGVVAMPSQAPLGLNLKARSQR